MGTLSKTIYDEDWATLHYFMSTRETAFTMDVMLPRQRDLDRANQLQRADIYNIHGCHKQKHG